MHHLGRGGSLIVRLRSEGSVFKPWPGRLCCVLEKDTLFSQCLSPPRCINGYRQIVAAEAWQIAGEVTCDGLASRPGEVEILLAASCYKNRDKLQQLWASPGSRASLSYLLILKTVWNITFPQGWHLYFLPCPIIWFTFLSIESANMWKGKDEPRGFRSPHISDQNRLCQEHHVENGCISSLATW